MHKIGRASAPRGLLDHDPDFVTVTKCHRINLRCNLFDRPRIRATTRELEADTSRPYNAAYDLSLPAMSSISISRLVATSPRPASPSGVVNHGVAA